ncbi:hypothetical protein ACLOJK_033218 [Asimina triloba]
MEHVRKSIFSCFSASQPGEAKISRHRLAMIACTESCVCGRQLGVASSSSEDLPASCVPCYVLLLKGGQLEIHFTSNK